MRVGFKSETLGAYISPPPSALRLASEETHCQFTDPIPGSHSIALELGSNKVKGGLPGRNYTLCRPSKWSLGAGIFATCFLPLALAFPGAVLKIPGYMIPLAKGVVLPPELESSTGTLLR